MIMYPVNLMGIEIAGHLCCDPLHSFTVRLIAASSRSYIRFIEFNFVFSGCMVSPYFSNLFRWRTSPSCQIVPSHPDDEFSKKWPCQSGRGMISLINGSEFVFEMKSMSCCLYRRVFMRPVPSMASRIYWFSRIKSMTPIIVDTRHRSHKSRKSCPPVGHIGTLL